MTQLINEAKNLVSELNRLRNKYSDHIIEYTENQDVNEVLRLLNFCDPTSQDGKFGGSYLEWMVRNYLPEKSVCYGDDDELSALRTILSTYESLKSKKQLVKMGLPTDLTKVPFEELSDKITDILNSGQFSTADNSTLRKIQEMGDQLKEVYNDGQFSIYAVFTKDANELLGSSSSWCTANNAVCFKNYGNLFFNIMPLDEKGVPMLKSSGRGQCHLAGNMVYIKNIHDKDIYNVGSVFNEGVENFVYNEMPKLAAEYSGIGEKVREKIQQNESSDLNEAFKAKYGVEAMDAVNETAGFVNKEFPIIDIEPFQNEYFVQWKLKGERGLNKTIQILVKKCLLTLVDGNRKTKQIQSMDELKKMSSVYDEAKELMVEAAGAAHRKFGDLNASVTVEFDLHGSTFYVMSITGDKNNFFEAALCLDTNEVTVRYMNNERVFFQIPASQMGGFLSKFLSSVLKEEKKHGKRLRMLSEAKNLDSEIFDGLCKTPFRYM